MKLIKLLFRIWINLRRSDIRVASNCVRSLGRFPKTVEKPKPKQLLRPITTGTNSAMNQSRFLAINCNSLEAREKSRIRSAIGFSFASHWLKNWRESFSPITKRSSRNHVVTFDSPLKTALNACSYSINAKLPQCETRSEQKSSFSRLQLFCPLSFFVIPGGLNLRPL